MLVRIACGVLVILGYGCGNPQADPNAFTTWAIEHAVPVHKSGSALSSAMSATIEKAVGSARLVGLGESRHDTREQLKLKSWLVQHLIEDLGFRGFILEDSGSHVEALDQYLATGQGNPRVLMNSLAGWYLWDTEEMLELIEWLRAFNVTSKPSERVRIFGIDITAPAHGVERVITALKQAGINTGMDAEALGLDLSKGDFWPQTWERYAAASEERRRELLRNYAKLLEITRTERAKIVAASSAEYYAAILWFAEVGQRGNEFFSAGDRLSGGVVRERGMALAALRILDQEMPGSKAVLWAHNLHVAKSAFRMSGLDEGSFQPMGVRLGQELGADYVAVGAAFGSGAYPEDLPPGERIFEALSQDTMDGALMRVGEPEFLIDLREVMRDSDAGRWLRQERGWRAQDMLSVIVPSRAFDLVYYVSQVSRAQPTPLALQRYRSQGRRR